MIPNSITCLQLLKDISSEVQIQAVKCLEPLLCKVNGGPYKLTLDILCLNLTGIPNNAVKLYDMITTNVKTIFPSFLQKAEANIYLIH